MDAKDLIIGEIYYHINNHIFKILSIQGDRIQASYIYKNVFTHYTNYFANTITATDFRKATQEEKQWLEACIEANKFIPREQIKFDIYYEIY